MSRLFVCQDPRCKFEHAYCHTCRKDVCEKGEADVHRSIAHEVQSGLDVRGFDSNPDLAELGRGYTVRPGRTY
jgi:hypothetical protein